MKRLFCLIVALYGIANAYCEYGSKQNQEFVQGGYYVTYSFIGGKNVGVKYGYGEMIPYYIRFDFSSMEMCR